MIVIFDTHVQNDDIPSNFFHFFEILIFWVFRREGVKGQKMTHNHQFQSISLYISTTVDHIIKIFGTMWKIMISPDIRYLMFFFVFF